MASFLIMSVLNLLFLVSTVIAAAAAAAAAATQVSGGELSGKLEGNIHLLGSVIVPRGKSLTVEPGTVVQVTSGAKIEVFGMLLVKGTQTNRVRFITSQEPSNTGASGWEGIDVSGTMNATALDVSGARKCLVGLEDSEISVLDGYFYDCGATLAVVNGGTFDNSTLLGGSSVYVTGGILRMTDTVIDLQHDGKAPDCAIFNGGGAILDHVRFTACHCPLHFNYCSDEVIITNSIFDLAAFPVMVARMKAKFTGNHFLKNDAFYTSHVLDVGGGLDVDISGNFYGGGGPTVGSFFLGQFRGMDDYSTEPFPGVGPRK